MPPKYVKVINLTSLSIMSEYTLEPIQYNQSLKIWSWRNLPITYALILNYSNKKYYSLISNKSGNQFNTLTHKILDGQ